MTDVPRPLSKKELAEFERVAIVFQALPGEETKDPGKEVMNRD